MFYFACLPWLKESSRESKDLNPQKHSSCFIKSVWFSHTNKRLNSFKLRNLHINLCFLPVSLYPTHRSLEFDYHLKFKLMWGEGDRRKKKLKYMGTMLKQKEEKITTDIGPKNYLIIVSKRLCSNQKSYCIRFCCLRC